MQLSFEIITTDNGTRVKVRDDGRRGPCVADEALLWDALQEARAEAERLRQDLAAAAERVAVQSEALTRKAERKR